MKDSHKLVQEHPIEWDDAKVARLWNYYARSPTVRSQYFAKVYGGFVLSRARLPRSTPLRVLDFGCGPGFMWRHVKRERLPWLYTGLDFSADAIATLNSGAHGENGFQGAVHAAGLPCELPSAHFDAVLLLEVVEHLTDERLVSTLREVRRLLKPNGTLVVTTPNNEDLTLASKFCPECGAVYHEWQHIRSWTPVTLASAMAEHGLIHERTWVGHWDDHHWAGWLFNRIAKVRLDRRTDVHMLGVYRASDAPATTVAA